MTMTRAITAEVFAPGHLGELTPVIHPEGHLRPPPAAPFSWDALAAGITLVAGIVLRLAYPPVRRGIRTSPLLKVGASAPLGTSGPQVTGELAPSGNRPTKPRR